ncbi:MAG: histidine kinase [Betaproteobacteria bacterium]|nr:histidine kinase [Betaproteobacteria bacterium]
MDVASPRHPVLRSLLSAWAKPHVGPPWAPWLWTMLLNLGIAIVLTLLVRQPTGDSAIGGFWATLVISQAIGLSIHSLFHWSGRLLGQDMFGLRGLLRVGYVTAVVIAGTWIGFSGAVLLLTGGQFEQTALILGSARGSLVFIPLFWGLFVVMLLAAIGRMRLRQLTAERDRVELMRAEREAIAARLALLSAQIEPHFLYNTLAHVRALITTDGAAAQRMIDALIAYLRSASRNMARSLVPLSEELDSVRGYLSVMQQRLGERLAVDWQVPAEALSLRVPPACLQTLAENAIKHGIEPAAGGGRIRIDAARVDAHREPGWTITVLDTGAGFDAPADGRGDGTGLANLRERLRLALGSSASVVLEREAGVTRATLFLPDAALPLAHTAAPVGSAAPSAVAPPAPSRAGEGRP